MWSVRAPWEQSLFLPISSTSDSCLLMFTKITFIYSWEGNITQTLLLWKHKRTCENLNQWKSRKREASVQIPCKLNQTKPYQTTKPVVMNIAQKIQIKKESKPQDCFVLVVWLSDYKPTVKITWSWVSHKLLGNDTHYSVANLVIVRK